MNNSFLLAFRKVDIDFVLEQFDAKEQEVIRFCLLYKGEDVFLQLCQDRKLKLNIYMQYEREMLRLCRLLYGANGGSLCLAIPTCNSENAEENPYARITMSLEGRKQLADECWKCKEVTSIHDLERITQYGCRCIGTAYFYFEGLNLCLIVDEIGGALLGNQAIAHRLLDKLNVDYEIN